MDSISLPRKIIYGILVFIHYFLIKIIFLAYILFSNNFEWGMLLLFIEFIVIVTYYLCEACLLSVLEYHIIPIHRKKTYTFFSEKCEIQIFGNIYLKKSLFCWHNPAILGLVVVFLLTLLKLYFIHYGKHVCEWENVYHQRVFLIFTGLYLAGVIFYIYKRFQKIHPYEIDIKNEKE